MLAFYRKSANPYFKLYIYSLDIYMCEFIYYTHNTQHMVVLGL